MNEQDLSQPHKIQSDLKMSESESSCQKCDQKFDITVQDQKRLWHPHLVLCQECDQKCKECDQRFSSDSKLWQHRSYKCYEQVNEHVPTGWSMWDNELGEYIFCEDRTGQNRIIRNQKIWCNVCWSNFRTPDC